VVESAAKEAGDGAYRLVAALLGLRGAHTEQRCAGVVDAAALASGEMTEGSSR